MIIGIPKELKDKDGNTVEKYEPEIVRQILSEKTADEMCEIMEYVVSDGGAGTAKVEGYRVGGKTGTAEMFENGESFDNGLFIAFAPFDNPQIVICVVGEGAGHGAYVAPIVRDMLDEYFSVGKSDRAASRQAENTLFR